MSKIVAIGGGKMELMETWEIDQEVVRLTEKKHPHALFIPTASLDREEYINIFTKIYGEKLGCLVETLLLYRERPSTKEIARKILTADLIYVGGGNTLRMLKIWRKLGIDKLLIQAHRKGIVMAGLSAGSVCWFEYGHSDSLRFSDENHWRYIRLKALGILKGIHSPHYRKEHRETSFLQMIEKRGGIGIALDNYCALEVVNGQYRIITSNQKNDGAFKVFKEKKQVHSQPILKENLFKPLSSLYQV